MCLYSLSPSTDRLSTKDEELLSAHYKCFQTVLSQLVWCPLQTVHEVALPFFPLFSLSELSPFRQCLLMGSLFFLFFFFCRGIYQVQVQLNIIKNFFFSYWYGHKPEITDTSKLGCIDLVPTEWGKQVWKDSDRVIKKYKVTNLDISDRLWMKVKTDSRDCVKYKSAKRKKKKRYFFWKPARSDRKRNISHACIYYYWIVFSSKSLLGVLAVLRLRRHANYLEVSL